MQPQVDVLGNPALPQPAPRSAGRPAPPLRTLRQRLFWLAISAMLPLIVTAGIGMAVLLQQQREQAETASLDFTRAFANAVEADLGRSVAVLGALSASPLLEGDDMAAYQALLMRVLGTLPDWRAVILADAEGRVLAHTAYEQAADAPPTVEAGSFARAVAERRPVVGSLAQGPNGHWGIPVRFPLLRDGEVRHVLSGVLKPEAILDVVRRQRVPDDWVVAVFDAHEGRVARSREHDAMVGRAPSPTLRQLLAGGAPEGIGMTHTLEGDRVFTAYVRLADSGWTIAAGLPSAALEAAQLRALGLYGGAVLLSLLLATVVAWLVAKRINRPIAELRQAARAVGRGERPAALHTDILEVHEVAETLADAANERLRSEAEREALLDAERRARKAAESARRRLELLAGIGPQLARSLEPAQTVEALARTVVPWLADHCSIDLVDDAGHLQPALACSTNEGGGVQFDPLSPGVGSSVVHGLPREAHCAPARAGAPGDTGVAPGQVSVPMSARGRTLGTLTAVPARHHGAWPEDDLALLAELAHRTALALDNARLYAQARQAGERAESANRAKDQFLAMLGHELRNPLAPILTSLQLMKLREPTLATRERGVIERQVAHLARLVDDLLDVSRIAQGKVQLERRRLDLRDVLARAVELSAPAFADRAPPEVTWPDAPLFVDGDETRLVQVVCNLLTNAVKFTPPQGAIRARLSGEGAVAEIAVSDEGRGIEPALLPQVFELFVQGEQALDRRAGGLGLGLGIVRMLAMLHGGEVAAHSAGPGQGSCFVVRLPCTPAPAATVAAAPAPVPAQCAGRVLLVDDNLDAAESLAELLGCVGYEVRTVHDAGAALAAVERFVPDIALLDIGLPGMDGYQLAAELRDDVRLQGLRLIALTGYGQEPDRARALAARFDEHLVKPVELGTLLRAMDGQR